MKVALQISPEAKSAYFSDYLSVAQTELKLVTKDAPFNLRQFGGLDFIEVDIPQQEINSLLRLSFVQGCYQIVNDAFIPLEQTADFLLHDDFVFGSKFKGKTNERLTQLLLNVGLSEINAHDQHKITLLDPMCGRATTLLWAMRYGIQAKGIEQDGKALEDITRNLKRWTKLHRQKHKLSDGFIGGNKKHGKFIDFSIEQTSMRVATGDARFADQIYKKDKFDLIVSDLPYGVQHFTTSKTRNPLSVIQECVYPWKKLLKKNGAIVLAFNSYQPKREALIQVFEEAGFAAQIFNAPHRMSESIVRDIVVFKLV